MRRRQLIFFIAIGAAAVVLAGCGRQSAGGSKTATAPARATATLTGPALQTPAPELRTPSPSLLVPRDIWLTAPAEPPPNCHVSTAEQFQPDAGLGIRIGPVHMVGWPNGILRVNLSYPATKVLLYFDQSAGNSVTMEGRRRDSGTPLLFYYDTGGQNDAITGQINVPADELGVSSLIFVGPFVSQRDAGRGYFLAREPGCYDITAQWAGGSATATVYFSALPGT